MYNKKTLTFTFHHYWRAFCQKAFVLGEPLSGGAFVLDPNISVLYIFISHNQFYKGTEITTI